MQLPFVSPELLAALQEQFPDRLPDGPVEPQNLGVLIGQQKVIRFLAHHHEIQTERSMTGA